MTITAPYHYEIPIPMFSPELPRPTRGVKSVGRQYETIEECIKACKARCEELGVNYSNRDVKLFMIDGDGEHEVTEEGELAD